MPKKKKNSGAAKAKAAARKADEKRRKKVVEDKTFGMKNKNKSKKVQRHIAIIKQNAQHAGKSRQEIQAERDAERRKKQQKEAKARAQAEERALMGMSKKDKVCPFYLQGKCRRGKKCAFKHVGQPQNNKGKLSVYADPRDNMENWDQKTLEEAVAKKSNQNKATTEIICKHFLDAIEAKKYGHFWNCPNGPKCIYRHCLPPGFVLKTPEDKLASATADQVDIGETIEIERKKLNLLECTPLTLEIFLKWKEERKAARDAEIETERKKAASKGGGRGTHILSGRALFEFDPSLFQDDEAAAADMEIKEDLEDEADGSKPKAFEPNFTPQAVPAEPAHTESKVIDKTTSKTKKKRKKKKKPAAAAASSPAPDISAMDASLFMDDEDLPDFE